ncbi:MAG TPA: MgtC/SapB family protein [Gemmataceae bacterium]|nr:MgtC/SapB family protein [Gemmataceae bacterium]
MPVTLGWQEITVRLALTVFAGALIGFNRTERGRPAGLRTTLLVCLAASVAMIQTNLLMGTAGRTPDSFIMLDLMRLPLGILTGMGFIGAGAVLRRGDIVHGVTTAATLWMVTIIGLCLGGGQLALGMIALALSVIVLWALQWLEFRVHQDRHATLILSLAADGPTEEDIRAAVMKAGHDIASADVSYKAAEAGMERTVRFEVRWRGYPNDFQTPPYVRQLTERPGVLTLQWRA